MDIVTASALNPSQKEEIQFLLAACRQKEPLTLSFPLEGADLYVLISQYGHVCSAAAFLKEEEAVWECSAFTHPAFRNQGFFSAALKEGLSVLPQETDLLFYSDGQSSDALKVLSSLEAEFLGSEYMMELSLNKTLFPSCPFEDIQMTECCADREKLLTFSGSYGSVKILVFESHYYLYDFEIQEPFRGRGHGKSLLLAVLGILAARKELPVSLQVSEDNRAAAALYEKTGFRITETLSCFLY